MATKIWDGTTGFWSTAASWTPVAGVPADGDDVVLPPSGAAYALTLDVATAALNSLTIGDPSGTALITFDLGANTLNVNGVTGAPTNTITLAEGGGGTLITLAGATVNALNLQFASASQVVSGFGTLALTGSTSGTGTLTATGGALLVAGTISAGVVLTIGTAAGSNLSILGAATSLAAIAINDANQKLEIGASGSLSIGALESITNGTIQLDGGTLTAGAGLDLGAGALLIGQGTVTASTLTGSGTITAGGGILTLAQSLAASTGIGFQIASSSQLQINGQASTGNVFAFLNNSGNSGRVGVADDTGMNATFSNMFVATGIVATDAIDIQGHTASIVTVTGQGTSSGTITLSDGAVLNLVNLTSTAWFANTLDNGAGGTLVFVSDTACYCPGTLILTDRGDVPVEQLAIGDRMMTFLGEPKPIKWIGRRAYDGRFIGGNRKILPIRIVAGALGDGVPARDLLVSPEHALYIDGVLVPASLLVNGATIIREESVERLEYFHIELEEHEVLFAEGAPAESYVDCDNRGMFQNADEFAALFPADGRPSWQFYAPRLEPHSVELAEIRGALLQRAETLGYTLGCDPDLRLIVDGESIRAQSVKRGVYRFLLPAANGPIWLASRSAVPAETEVCSEDMRRLGVPIRRIVLQQAQLHIEIGCGHTSLRDGFHTAEGGHRWTDGMARLPDELLQAVSGEVTIQVHLTRMSLRYPLDQLHRPSTNRRPAAAARQMRFASR